MSGYSEQSHLIKKKHESDLTFTYKWSLCADVLIQRKSLAIWPFLGFRTPPIWEELTQAHVWESCTVPFRPTSVPRYANNVWLKLTLWCKFMLLIISSWIVSWLNLWRNATGTSNSLKYSGLCIIFPFFHSFQFALAVERISIFHFKTTLILLYW